MNRARWIALGIVVVAIPLAFLAFNPVTVCEPGPDPECEMLPAFFYRLWTLTGAILVSVSLVLWDAVLRFMRGEDRETGPGATG